MIALFISMFLIGWVLFCALQLYINRWDRLHIEALEKRVNILESQKR